MKVFKLEIKLDGQALNDEPLDETARILRELADKLDNAPRGIFLPHSLYDINGNMVGKVTVVERKKTS